MSSSNGVAPPAPAATKAAICPLKSQKGPSRDFFYGETVTVLVGPNKKEFRVHKPLICHFSAFFEKALNGSFAEASSGRVPLADVDEEHFHAFVQWMYSRRLEANRAGPDGEPERLDFRGAAEVYVLGDRLMAPELKNAAVNAFYGAHLRTAGVPDASVVAYIYEHILVKEAPLRRSVVDMYARKADFEAQFPVGAVGAFPEEFLLAVLRRTETWRWNPTDDGEISYAGTCEFHEHEGMSPPKKEPKDEDMDE